MPSFSWKSNFYSGDSDYAKTQKSYGSFFASVERGLVPLRQGPRLSRGQLIANLVGVTTQAAYKSIALTCECCRINSIINCQINCITNTKDDPQHRDVHEDLAPHRVVPDRSATADNSPWLQQPGWAWLERKDEQLVTVRSPSIRSPSSWNYG